MPNYKSVAEWMAEEVMRQHSLYQETVVYDIHKRFGKEFTYFNPNGNLAIHRKILAEFNKLTADSVVWERGERCWRKRADYDSPGRQQD